MARGTKAITPDFEALLRAVPWKHDPQCPEMTGQNPADVQIDDLCQPQPDFPAMAQAVSAAVEKEWEPVSKMHAEATEGLSLEIMDLRRKRDEQTADKHRILREYEEQASALRAEVERLRREIEAADRVQAYEVGEFTKAQAEVARLRAALEKYGDHKYGCAALGTSQSMTGAAYEVTNPGGCTCGYAVAVAPQGAETGPR